MIIEGEKSYAPPSALVKTSATIISIVTKHFSVTFLIEGLVRTPQYGVHGHRIQIGQEFMI